MKKCIIIIICLCIIPTIAMAGNDSPITSTVAVCGGWCLIDYRDGVTYEKSYLVQSISGNPGLIFRLNNKPSAAFLFIDGNINGTKITYRVDKNPPVTFIAPGKSFAIEGNAYNIMVKDFKAGNFVTYTIKLGKYEKTEGVSLIGFTELYNRAVSLSKKMKGGVDYLI